MRDRPFLRHSTQPSRFRNIAPDPRIGESGNTCVTLAYGRVVGVSPNCASLALYPLDCCVGSLRVTTGAFKHYV